DRHGMNPIKEFQLLKYYIRIMKKYKPDVVLSYTIKPNKYGGIAAKKLKIPIIPNITGLGTAVEPAGVLQKFSIFLYKIAVTNIYKVFFQNEENMKFFIKNNIALGKHQLIPGSGVNLNHFGLLDYPKEETVDFVFIS